MSNQLIKTTEQGKENVFPRTRIQDLFDDTSGQKLIDILNSFNMLFVPYLGNKPYTRNQISPELRRQGLWLTYVIDNTVYTEWYDKIAIDDTNWGSDTNWRQGSNALVGDLSVSPNGTWVINGEDSGITIKGDKGDSPVIRIYNNKIQVSYDKGVTYEDLNNTPIYTKFRFNRSTNTYQVSTDLGQNWTDVSSDKVYYQFRYNGETNTHQVSTDFGTTWTNISEDKVFYQFRTEGNRLQVSTDLGANWNDCSEPIAAWFRWADTSGTGNVGKIQISRDQQNWSDLSPTMTNNLYIKGYVSTVGDLPSNATIGDIYMVGPTYDESDTTHDYPHYRMWVKQSSGWVDNGEYQSNVQISQTTGQETGITMSQKAITNSIEVETTRATAAEQAIIFDVSAHNDGAVFESISALLDSSNLDTIIPVSFRHGGMTIRFIQGSVPNSNNKYAHYRLMTTYFSTSKMDWQGVDDEPTAGSDNLVKSGGVKEELRKKVNVINDSESKLTDNSDGFYFTDKSGNVIAKITDNGLQAIKFLNKDGGEIDETYNEIKEDIARLNETDNEIKEELVLNKTDVDNRLTEIEKTKVSIDNNHSETKILDNSDGFYFTDKNYNIIAKITDNGLQSINFLDKDGNEIGSEGIEGENGTLPIILNNKLTPSPRKVHPLYGKDIYSFGDSLCKGAWEKMLADITGANFNKKANNLTSWGGSFTGDEGGPLYNEEGYGQNGDRPGGLRRAKNFVLMPKETYGNKDIIFFENVHDGVLESENISAKPFMWTRYAIYEGQEFYDTNVAGNYFNNNRSSILQSVGFTTPQVGTMVKMKVKAVTIPLVFSNGATANGSVKISINGNDFETEVTEGDSIEQVIDKISVWSFSDSTGWKNKKLNSTTINLQYVGGNDSSENDIITFDGQGTGVAATVENKTETVAYRTHAFLSLDINEWNNSEAWSYYAQHSRCYSNWKGVIEYIQRNCPETKMYMLLFPNSIYKKSYARPDGSFDVEAFYASTPWQQHIDNRRCLINVADYYNIPIIDLEKEMNVMCNWETYFPENNVHMKTSLYQRFAEIIASKIY